MPYRHLSENERYVISHLYSAGKSFREIGRRLNRSHSTIRREIKKFETTFPLATYWYDKAQKLSEKRKREARHCRRLTNNKLVGYVVTRLRKQWSPEAIAGRLVRDYPDDTSMRVSHECIYRWIYLRL